MYVNVELLPSSLERAVQNDIQSFQKSCAELGVQNLKPAELLEEGCERTTQLFSCRKKDGSYIDLSTKIAIRGLLLNVVLSADTANEISKYRDDYDYILRHLTVVR